jgi:hypothetical protein
MVDRHAVESAGDAMSYAEIQFHDRVGLKDVQSIDLIRTDPGAGEAAQMAHTGIDYEAFGKMSKDEQATYLERFARGQQDAAAKIRASLAEKGFPDIEVRTGFLNRELIAQEKNPDYMPGVRGRGNPEYIPKYSEKIVYDTADELAENQIGLLDSLRTSHLQGSAMEGNFARAHDEAASALSPSMSDLKAAIASSRDTMQGPQAVSRAVTRAGKMSESTLQGTMDAAATAVKVMRGVL